MMELDEAAAVAAGWHAQARRNVAKWGLQDIPTLALALAEENGEIAQAVLKHQDEGGPLERIAEEVADAAALLYQMLDAVEAMSVLA